MSAGTSATLTFSLPETVPNLTRHHNTMNSIGRPRSSLSTRVVSEFSRSFQLGHWLLLFSSKTDYGCKDSAAKSTAWLCRACEVETRAAREREDDRCDVEHQVYIVGTSQMVEQEHSFNTHKPLFAQLTDTYIASLYLVNFQHPNSSNKHV